MSYPKPRQIAIDVLTLSQKTQVPVERILSNALIDSKLSPKDSNLCRELVSGCVRWRRLLDWLINRHTNKNKQKPTIQEILRLGLYQIFFLNRIPEHAIVNESVILAKANNHTRQSGFINALMRRFLREKSSVFKVISQLQDEQPALGQSHPDWLFEKWEQRWGREKAIRLLEWNNQPAPTYARLNRLNKETEHLVKRWESEKVEAIPFDCDWAKQGTIYQLRKHPKIETLQSFRDGLFYIQDPSTLLSVDFLKPQTGQKILDLCAAPGGKTSLIADRINNHGEITSTDINKSRL
ncbi:MAG: transcription antitermination factor NusB, partial [Verrucomicrobiota bacterium]|nr:transcription antitermination factor NusB [Verrucomicrobiota bacterium]